MTRLDVIIISILTQAIFQMIIHAIKTLGGKK